MHSGTLLAPSAAAAAATSSATDAIAGEQPGTCKKGALWDVIRGIRAARLEASGGPPATATAVVEVQAAGRVQADEEGEGRAERMLVETIRRRALTLVSDMEAAMATAGDASAAVAQAIDAAAASVELEVVETLEAVLARVCRPRGKSKGARNRRQRRTTAAKAAALDAGAADATLSAAEAAVAPAETEAAAAAAVVAVRPMPKAATAALSASEMMVIYQLPRNGKKPVKWRCEACQVTLGDGAVESHTSGKKHRRALASGGWDRGLTGQLLAGECEQPSGQPAAPEHKRSASPALAAEEPSAKRATIASFEPVHGAGNKLTATAAPFVPGRATHTLSSISLTAGFLDTLAAP
eukprot:6505567-Prymnesium_polylepis.1